VNGLVNRWRFFWKDFNCKEDWKFPELPPVQLEKSLAVPWSFVDRSEYVRLEWMWSRKPRLIMGDGGLGYAILILVALLFLLIPHVGVLLAIAWSFVALSAIARDIVCSIRWRREYEVSINRIMRSYRHLR
jgi:hypothetical protein